MATSQRPLRLLPAMGGHAVQYNAGFYQTTDPSHTHIHLKTNIPRTSDGFMVNVEAVGFAYGAAQPIRASWVFYQWANTLYSLGYETIYPGLTPQAVYYSADNFVCLRGALSASYFLGVGFNVYSPAGDGWGKHVSFTSIVSNTVSGNHF